jgi:hypothetical protein
MQKDRQSYAPYYSESNRAAMLLYGLRWGGFSPEGLLALELSASAFFLFLMSIAV